MPDILKKMNVPFLDFEGTNQIIREEMISAFTQFFDSKWYILGEGLKTFEDQYAEFNNTKYCIGTSNGLDALHLCLKALDIGEGDEVIVPSHTFIATILAISYCGATPVFVEPDPVTYNMDPNKIEDAVSSKTKAIIPVHLYGQPCDMTAVKDIAERHELFIIEDNAQSQGAKWDGQLTGSIGHLNAVSFYPGKNLGALGDAGAITTNDKDLAEKVRSLRNYGSHKKYHNDVIGYNNRMDECQAAFLSVKLKYLEKWNVERRAVARQYMNLLEGVDDCILPGIANDAESVFHLFVIRCSRRDELQQYLKKQGIGTLIHYPIPVHLQAAYKHLGYKKGDFPLAEELAETVLSLPLYIGMEEGAIEYVAQEIKNFSTNVG